MQAVPRTLADKFAQAFAGDKAGFSAKEITEYFSKYSNLVKPYDHYGMKPVRKDLFIDAVYVLTPKQQYYALNDLTWTDRASKYAYPSVDTRLRLREALHSFISPDPIGLRFSKLRETAFREDWVSCLTRFENDPAATITAARTLLETVLKTIISERGGTPDASGDLVRLLRQAQESVGFLRANGRSPQKLDQSELE